MLAKTLALRSEFCQPSHVTLLDWHCFMFGMGIYFYEGLKHVPCTQLNLWFLCDNYNIPQDGKEPQIVVWPTKKIHVKGKVKHQFPLVTFR